MWAVALVVQGLIPPATAVTARPLATAVAPRVAVVRPPLAPAHRSRCGSVRLQAEDDEASDSFKKSGGARRRDTPAKLPSMPGSGPKAPMALAALAVGEEEEEEQW